MTREGFRGINIYEEVYNMAKEYIEKINMQSGYKKIRSMAQLVEMALEHYIKSNPIGERHERKHT